MKRFVLLLLLLIGCQVYATSSPGLSADSVLHWLATDDWSAWSRAVKAAQVGEVDASDLPTDLIVPFLSEEQRPEWALGLRDTSLWMWMQSAQLILWARHQRLELNLGAEKAAREAHLAGLGYWRVATSALLLLGFACLGGVVWLKRRERRQLELDGLRWPAMVSALQKGEVDEDATLEWQSLKRSFPRDVKTGKERWEKLSAPEKEVAQMLVELLPVRKIAKQMACSPSHIYNVRSSIRRKWDLASEDDLLEAISRELQSMEVQQGGDA